MSRVAPDKLSAFLARNQRGGAVDWDEHLHPRAEAGRFGAKPGAKEAKAGRLRAELEARRAKALAPKAKGTPPEEPKPEPKQGFKEDIAKNRAPDDYEAPKRLDPTDEKVARTMATGQISRSEGNVAGGHVNEAIKMYIVGADGKEQKALFKPLAGEAPIYKEIKNLFTREVAVSRAAPLFDVKGPPVVFRQVDGQMGSCQKWDHDVMPSDEMLRQRGVAIDRASVEKLRVMDIVLGNTDRHGGNVMWRVEGKKAVAVPIDNGYSIPDKPVSHQWFGQVLDYGNTSGWGGKPLPETMKMLNGIKEKQLSAVLLSAGIPPNCVEQSLLRLRALKGNADKWLSWTGGGAKGWEAERMLTRAQREYQSHVSDQDLKEVAGLVRTEAKKAILADDNVKKLWNTRGPHHEKGLHIPGVGHVSGHGPPGPSADVHEPTSALHPSELARPSPEPRPAQRGAMSAIAKEAGAGVGRMVEAAKHGPWSLKKEREGAPRRSPSGSPPESVMPKSERPSPSARPVGQEGKGGRWLSTMHGKNVKFAPDTMKGQQSFGGKPPAPKPGGLSPIHQSQVAPRPKKERKMPARHVVEVDRGGGRVSRHEFPNRKAAKQFASQERAKGWLPQMRGKTGVQPRKKKERAQLGPHPFASFGQGH